MAVIKMSTNNKFGKDVEKGELLYVVGKNANWCCYYGKQYGGSSKN